MLTLTLLLPLLLLLLFIDDDDDDHVDIFRPTSLTHCGFIVNFSLFPPPFAACESASS